MFDWVLSTPFIYNVNQLLFDAIFYRKGFSEQDIEIWILIPSILQNIFLLHVKKIYTKYDKICICEKNPHENYYREKKY